MITPMHIAQASDEELICMTYELFLEALRDRKISYAKEVLLVLTENLNFEVALAKELFNLYVYVQNILINHSQEEEKLEEAYRLIDMIYKGYKELAKHSPKAQGMRNAQTVYAGMTYGKGHLNEVMVEAPNRGFKA